MIKQYYHILENTDSVNLQTVAVVYWKIIRFFIAALLIKHFGHEAQIYNWFTGLGKVQ